mgnify:CR=1 FL=1
MTVEPFRAITVSRLAHQLKAEGRSIIHMEFGQPSTGAPAAAGNPQAVSPTSNPQETPMSTVTKLLLPLAWPPPSPIPMISPWRPP